MARPLFSLQNKLMDTAKTLRRTIFLRRLLSSAAALAASLLLTPAHAAGSAEAGQARSVVCAACHGADGNSFNPEWPSLAGQNENYLIKSLQSFKDGSRQNVARNYQDPGASLDHLLHEAA